MGYRGVFLLFLLPAALLTKQVAELLPEAGSGPGFEALRAAVIEHTCAPTEVRVRESWRWLHAPLPPVFLFSWHQPSVLQFSSENHRIGRARLG